MATDTQFDPSTPAGVAGIMENISFYLNLKLSAKEQGVDVKIPDAVNQIIELATSLPVPTVAKWAALAVGKMPKDSKPKASKNEGDNNRSRGKWTEENKAELIRLVDDEDFRKEILGDAGTHQGHPNWSVLARRYGFSGNAPIHRQYKLSTGRDPPGCIKPKPAQEAAKEAADGEPALKKAKTGGPSVPPPSASTADGWTHELGLRLIKLVEDEDFRKKQTGKRNLKWSRVAEVVGKAKKDCKKKYTALTGKIIED